MRIRASSPGSSLAGDESALVIGREDTIHLRAAHAQCVAELFLRDGSGKQTRLAFKSTGAGELEVKVPLQDAPSGDFAILVQDLGAEHPHRFPCMPTPRPAGWRASRCTRATRRGSSAATALDEVDGLVIRGIDFSPGTLSATNGRDELTMLGGSAPGGTAAPG